MWGGFNRTAIDLDLEPPPLLFDQGAGDRASDNASIKLDVALKQSNRLQAFVYTNDSEIDRIGAGPTRSPEATLDLDAPTEIWKLEDSHVFGPTLYVQAHLSRVEGEVELEPRGGAAVEPTVDAARRLQKRLSRHHQHPGPRARPPRDQRVLRRRRREPRDDGGGRPSPRRGDHAVAVGPAELRLSRERLGERRRDQPVLPVRRARTTLDANSIYVQDTLTKKNLIADVGMRYDSQEGERDSTLLPAHPVRPDLLPAIDLPGTGGALEWGSLAPRVGLTYGIGEKHATLLRASWSRFVDQMGTSMFDDAIARPQLSPFPFAAVRFFDSDGDRQADPTETQSTIPGTMGGTVIDPSLDAPLTDEILFGAEHAGVGCFSIGGRLTWRRYQDLLDARPFVRDATGEVRVATRDDYLPDTIATGYPPRWRLLRRPGVRAAPRARPDRNPAPRQRRSRGRALRRHGAGWSVACATVGSSAPTPTSATRRRRSSPSCSRSTIPPTCWASTTTTTRRSLQSPCSPTSAASISTAGGTTRWRGSIAREPASASRSSLTAARATHCSTSRTSSRATARRAASRSPKRTRGRSGSTTCTCSTCAPRRSCDSAVDAAVMVSLDVLNLLNATPPLERDTRLETPTADFVREIVAPRVFRVAVRVELR